MPWRRESIFLAVTLVACGRSQGVQDDASAEQPARATTSTSSPTETAPAVTVACTWRHSRGVDNMVLVDEQDHLLVTVDLRAGHEMHHDLPVGASIGTVRLDAPGMSFSGRGGLAAVTRDGTRGAIGVRLQRPTSIGDAASPKPMMVIPAEGLAKEAGVPNLEPRTSSLVLRT